MLTLTDTSIEKIQDMAEKENLSDASVRMSVVGGGCSGFSLIVSVPGSLMNLSRIVANERVNIIHIEHDRMSTAVPINHTISTLYLELRGREHLESLLQKLLVEGYEVWREDS